MSKFLFIFKKRTNIEDQSGQFLIFFTFSVSISLEVFYK